MIKSAKDSGHYQIRRLRECGLLVVLRPGVRGRVAAYRLCRHTVTQLTADHWAYAGTDFVERMAGPPVPPSETNVLNFPPQSAAPPELPLWAQVIAADDPVLYRNWFARISAKHDRGTVVFHAPSDFIARQIETRFLRQMQEAARYAWPSAHGIRVVAIEHTPAGTAHESHRD